MKGSIGEIMIGITNKDPVKSPVSEENFNIQ